MDWKARGSSKGHRCLCPVKPHYRFRYLTDIFRVSGLDRTLSPSWNYKRSGIFFPTCCFLAHVFFPPGLINSCLNPEREALLVHLIIHSHHRAQWLACPVIIYIRKRFWGAAVTQQPHSHLQKLLCFVRKKPAFVYTPSLVVYRDMKTKVAKVNRSSFSP